MKAQILLQHGYKETCILSKLYENSDMLTKKILIKVHRVSTKQYSQSLPSYPSFYCYHSFLTSTYFIVRTKARLITEMIESPEKMAQEKQQYISVRQGMARPGIVDLATGNSRLTFDLSSSGRLKTSGSGGLGGPGSGGGERGRNSFGSRTSLGSRNSVGSRNSTSANSTSQQSQQNQQTGTTSPENLASPRSSLDAWTQQSNSGVYSKQKARAPRKSSMEGRYSLSLQLHSIKEEAQHGQSNSANIPGPKSKPFPSSSDLVGDASKNTNVDTSSGSSTSNINTNTNTSPNYNLSKMPHSSVDPPLTGQTTRQPGHTVQTQNFSNPALMSSPISSNNPFFGMTSQPSVVPVGSNGQNGVVSSQLQH